MESQGEAREPISPLLPTRKNAVSCGHGSATTVLVEEGSEEGGNEEGRKRGRKEVKCENHKVESLKSCNHDLEVGCFEMLSYRS